LVWVQALDPATSIIYCPAPFTTTATSPKAVSIGAAGSVSIITCEQLGAGVWVNHLCDVNAEVAANNLGLGLGESGLGESGGRSEAHEANGRNDIDQNDGLHVDVLRGEEKRKLISIVCLLSC